MRNHPMCQMALWRQQMLIYLLTTKRQSLLSCLHKFKFVARWASNATLGTESRWTIPARIFAWYCRWWNSSPEFRDPEKTLWDHRKRLWQQCNASATNAREPETMTNWLSWSLERWHCRNMKIRYPWKIMWRNNPWTRHLILQLTSVQLVVNRLSGAWNDQSY